MSALGHKRTFRSAIAMSALPPKADIEARQSNVRFVPIADIARYIAPPCSSPAERQNLVT